MKYLRVVTDLPIGDVENIMNFKEKLSQYRNKFYCLKYYIYYKYIDSKSK